MKNAKVIFVYNNTKDSILLDNGEMIIVNNEVFKDFIRSAEMEIAFSDWAVDKYWDGKLSWFKEGELPNYDGFNLEFINSIQQCAEKYGEIIAYYNSSNYLKIIDVKKWEEIKKFYDYEKDI